MVAAAHRETETTEAPVYFPCECDFRCHHHHDTDLSFYVSMFRTSRKSILMGPFATHQDAIDRYGRRTDPVTPGRAIGSQPTG